MALMLTRIFALCKNSPTLAALLLSVLQQGPSGLINIASEGVPQVEVENATPMVVVGADEIDTKRITAHIVRLGYLSPFPVLTYHFFAPTFAESSPCDLFLSLLITLQLGPTCSADAPTTL